MKTCEKATIVFIAMICLMLSSFAIGYFIDKLLGFGVLFWASMGAIFSSVFLKDEK